MKTISLISQPMISPVKYWNLVKGFVIREIRGRFAGTAGGLMWALATPLVTIIVYLFVFSLILRVQVTASETGTDSFGVYFLCGLFPWLLFADGISNSVGCLLNNANLITKVVFPVEVLPLSSVVSGYVINGTGMALFWIYLAFTGYAHWMWFMVIPVLFLQMVFTLGLALLLSSACVFIRDIKEVTGIIIMIWFFITPVFYPMSMVPDGIREFMTLNPMVGYMQIYRGILLVHKIYAQEFIVVTGFSVFSYAAGAWFFMRAKRAFGDVL
ncbi:MAG: ABC transporter permease [Deltaproteobacteria bacterium]|nr:ABC transporter permease [Deltaproteobacteria bacterium]